MRKPECCLCGSVIEANERYYLVRGRTVCRGCEERIRPLFKKCGIEITRSRE